jgi:hypothetical protein
MADAIELTADMEEELLQSGGTTCPKCGGQSVGFNDREIEIEDDTIVRKAQCTMCSCSWNLTFKLMDVSGWHDPGSVDQEKAIKFRKRMDSYRQAADAIAKRIEKALVADGQNLKRVIYSAYETDDDDVPIDNLDEVPVEGRIKLVAGADWNEDGERYESDWVESPTYLQLAVMANAMLHQVRDGHHLYFEGIYKGKKDGIYHFCMGS